MPKRVEVKLVKPKQRSFYLMRWWDPLTGELREKSTETKNRRTAEKIAREKQLELSRHDAVDDRIRWKDFRQRYEDEYLATMAEGTLHSFQMSANMLEKHSRPRLLADVDASLLSQFAAKRRKQGVADTTIAKNLRMIRASLGWAVEIGLMETRPRIRMPKRERGKRSLMRGRPITDEEFAKLIKACKEVRPDDHLDWEQFLNGLFWSGLRLGEAIELSWDADAGFSVDMSRRPVFKIYAESQKGNRDELCPMAPEFAQILQKVPKAERQGKVFEVAKSYQYYWFVHTIRKIGQRANVVVDRASESFATAHTLRKSFGTRWARRVKPAVLQRLMRHAHIQTTMQFYVDLDVEDIADEVWAWGS